jgi:chaperonin cofactor prefoldin
MILRVLCFLSSLLVAGCAAWFSVLGIATLFSGSYTSVLIMASSLELGKLVATTYLHHYWSKTGALLKTYLLVAISMLMCITSLGIFGYLSAAYSSNSSKFALVDSRIEAETSRKASINSELEQIQARVETLNSARRSQEERLPKMSAANARPIYADIERTAAEIERLSARMQTLQDNKISADAEIANLKGQIGAAKDIGTFKFVADHLDVPLDTVVMWFVAIIIAVFDPLAIALLLAYNSTLTRTIPKDRSIDLSDRIYDLSKD